MRLRLCISVLMLTASVSAAIAQGTLSVPYTAGMQAGIAAQVSAENATCAANPACTDDPWTLASYGIAECQAAWQSFENQRILQQQLDADIVTKYQNLPLGDTDRAAVETYIDACISNGGCS